MFEDYGALAPLREAAELLAAHEWPRLYDAERLAASEVPAAAAIYAEDPYVDRALLGGDRGAIRGLRPWITNEYEHNGLRADGAASSAACSTSPAGGPDDGHRPTGPAT